MDVSIVLINYNTKKITDDCIKSIIANTSEVEYEIIVVDNDSCDGSKEIFEKDKRIVFIESGSNLGFGKANNLGESFAQCKYLFLLNTDTILHNNAIKIFKDIYEKGDNIGILGTLLLNKDGSIGNSCGSFPKWYSPITDIIKKIKRLLYFKSKKNKFYFKNNISQVDYVIGADMFMEKKTFDEVGGFDSLFFMNGEEVELTKRISDLGKNVYLADGPKITHLEGASENNGQAREKRLSFFTIYCLIVGNNIFAMKHFSFISRYVFFILNFISKF